MNTVPRREGAGPNPPTEAETEASFRVLLEAIAEVLDVPVRGVGTLHERHLLLTQRAEAVRLAVARTCPPEYLAEWLRADVAKYAPLPSQEEVPGE